jgi:hypothetical protein
VENAFIESFNGRLRDECLSVSWFLTLADARHQIEHWRRRPFKSGRPDGRLVEKATRPPGRRRQSPWRDGSRGRVRMPRGVNAMLRRVNTTIRDADPLRGRLIRASSVTARYSM